MLRSAPLRHRLRRLLTTAARLEARTTAVQPISSQPLRGMKRVSSERRGSMLTLYFSPGSSAMAVHIALHEIGVDFERRHVSFEKREQYSPEYLAINPEGKV